MEARRDYWAGLLGEEVKWRRELDGGRLDLGLEGNLRAGIKAKEESGQTGMTQKPSTANSSFTARLNRTSKAGYVLSMVIVAGILWWAG